jgi:hypothetical protein
VTGGTTVSAIDRIKFRVASRGEHVPAADPRSGDHVCEPVGTTQTPASAANDERLLSSTDLTLTAERRYRDVTPKMLQEIEERYGIELGSRYPISPTAVVVQSGGLAPRFL